MADPLAMFAGYPAPGPLAAVLIRSAALIRRTNIGGEKRGARSYIFPGAQHLLTGEPGVCLQVGEVVDGEMPLGGMPLLATVLLGSGSSNTGHIAPDSSSGAIPGAQQLHAGELRLCLQAGEVVDGKMPLGGLPPFAPVLLGSGSSYTTNTGPVARFYYESYSAAIPGAPHASEPGLCLQDGEVVYSEMPLGGLIPLAPVLGLSGSSFLKVDQFSGEFQHFC